MLYFFKLCFRAPVQTVIQVIQNTKQPRKPAVKRIKRYQKWGDFLKKKIEIYVIFFLNFVFQGSCSNCDSSNSKYQAAQKASSEKDKTIRELKALCSKFEKQLTQQDALLKQWAESKGHKVNGYPK